MGKTRAERFLAAFNTIEKALKDEFDMHRHFSFSRMIETVKKKHPVVSKHEADLKKFAELRNVIVHERIAPNYIIAEPHMELVELIEKIRDQILQPTTVVPIYARSVRTFQHDQSLGDVLRIIKELSFTQFPIYEAKQFIGLLTDNGIATWLAHQANDCAANVASIPLSEVLSFEKHVNNVLFVHKETTIYEAKDLFVHHFDHKMTRLEAILITETGRKNEKLLGIITPYDAIRID